MGAQADLVRAYSRRLRGLVRTVVRQPSAEEDLVQMALIKMVRALPGLRDRYVFESWLFRLARTVAVDYLRRQKCRPVTVAAENELLNTPDSRRDDTVAEISEALERAFQRLSPKDREVMRLIVQGHSYRTIADRSGMSVGAVKTRVSRLRAFLRASVGTETGTRCTKSQELPARPGFRLLDAPWSPAVAV